jgi:hypothetical protein
MEMRETHGLTFKGEMPFSSKIIQNWHFQLKNRKGK